MNHGRTVRLIFLGVLVLASLALAPSPQERHCVVHVFPEGKAPASQPTPVCFATLEEAQRAVEATTSTVIGVDYMNSNFGGSSLTSTTTNPNGCSDGTTYAVNVMPAGWNNVISSAKSYQGCAHFYHYENTYQGGSSYDCGWSCATMGIMDNNTSSERWTR